MSFFGINYSKAGPGVNKNEPMKTAFFRFLDLYFRILWNLVKINVLYFLSVFIFFIPIYVYIRAGYQFNTLLFFASLLPIALTGPATAGFIYELRNLVREQHVFIWSDFVETAKKNWKQSTIVALINSAMIGISAVVIPFYYIVFRKDSLFYIIPLIVLIVALVIYVFMQYYVSLMLITFDLHLREIYKNALIFSFLGLMRNILITVISGAILYLVINVIPLGFLLIPIIVLSTIGFIINFCAWPVIEKYMMKPVEDQKETKSIFEDMGKEK